LQQNSTGKGSGSIELITTILAFIVVLGITITIHEFGHFAMAKLLKIRVLIFSIGFGPKLLGFTRGGTEYRLSPIPLGGYVKMAGETYDSDREGAPDEFLSHPRWHRFLVAVSGPFMNVLLAVAILAFFNYTQGVIVAKHNNEPAVVGPVEANSIAKNAGLESGDLILSVHGNPVHTWSDLEIALLTAPKGTLKIEVSRDNKTFPLSIPLPDIDQVDTNSLGFRFNRPKTVVYSVEANSPADKAGLQAGDIILSVTGNGKTGNDFSQILNIISESSGIPLDFQVLRVAKGTKHDIWDTPDNKLPGKTLELIITPIERGGRALIGFSPDYRRDSQKFGFAGAVTESIRQNYERVSLTFRVIGRMLKGSASARNLSGPIGIAQISGEAARTRDIRFFLEFIGFISLQLGIFNLLPIPILDGGMIALLVIEGVIRRDLSLNLKEKIVQVGFVFLILLMGFAVFNDLSKVINFTKIFG
jgi:regulator of sigma E protease